MGGIYFIYCLTNNKIYVGSAKDLQARWREHKAQLNAQKHFNINLQRAWLKYGEQSFEYKIHEIIGDYDRRTFFDRENFWMESLRREGKSLFNIAKAEGGWGPETLLRKDEIGAKISQSLLRHSKSLTPEERKIKYGKGKKGKPLSEEHKRKTSEGLKNKPKSEQTKNRMRIAQLNLSDEIKMKKAEAMSKIGKKRLGSIPSNAKPIVFRGVEYSSTPACKRETGLTTHEILKEVYGPDYRKSKKTI